MQWVGKKPLESVEFYPAQEKEVYGDKSAKEFNKLFWGDNLQVLSHLLKDYRGKVDLIYIDPPFDSKAEYVRRVLLRGEKVEGEQQGLLEEKQYTDIWEKDEYLQFMYERLTLMRELLSETGSIYLHCDWHKNSYLRLIMDEIFGESNFQNEIVWHYKSFHGQVQSYFPRKHDTLLFYRKSKKATFTLMRNEEIPIEEMIDFKNWGKYIVNENEIRGDNMPTDVRFKRYLDKWIKDNKRKPTKDDVVYIFRSQSYDDVWDIRYLDPKDITERTSYPTQKPEDLIERLIKSSTKEGDVVADFFVGSGTACVSAQKLGRRWIGCDINLGAIQTATKRLNQVITEQQKESKPPAKFTGSFGFKILNVNDYDVFKNELEAKEIVMELYGIESIKRSYFDGILDKNFVKVMPLNRVLNKADIRSLLKSVSEKIDGFTVKTKSKSGEPVYEEGVMIVCSGTELDVLDFLKKENKTGIRVDIRDILTDKKNLIFKQKPEARLSVKTKGTKLEVQVKDFFSPILMRKIEVENERTVSKGRRTKVGDYKQIIDSVAVDVDYNGKLFNAEVMDLPTKKEVINGTYQWEYPKKGKYTVAVKIVDVLGEEYFETFEVVA